MCARPLWCRQVWRKMVCSKKWVNSLLKLVIQSPHSSTKALLTFLGLLVKQSSHNLSTRRVQPSTCLLFLASAFYLRHPLGLGSLPSCSVSCCYMLETRLQVLSSPVGSWGRQGLHHWAHQGLTHGGPLLFPLRGHFLPCRPSHSWWTKWRSIQKTLNGGEDGSRQDSKGELQ